jgi:hypothetical protein
MDSPSHIHIPNGASFHVSRDGGPTQVLTFGAGDLTAECVQASINHALGTDAAVRVVTDGDRQRYAAQREEERRNYRAPNDRTKWLNAEWAGIGSGGSGPGRMRRYHHADCRWSSASREWECAPECNVPRWIEEEAAADE